MKFFSNSIIKLLLILFFLFGELAYSQGRWIKIQTPTNKNLKSIFFVDSLKGWVAGDSGVIYRTNDGGLTWSFQQSNVNTTIHDLFFLDTLRGWGLTWHRNIFGPVGTTILKTTNGGQTWQTQVYSNDFHFFYSITFQNELNGWLCGFPGSILRTRNGGLDWDEVKFINSQFSEFPIFKIKFINENYGIGCGGVIDIFGVIWRTTDGGEFWDSFPIGPEPINDFQIINNDFIFAVGGDYEYGTAVSHSTNLGLTWNYRTLDIFGIANSVAFRNAQEGWINLKGERKFLYTLDSGNTWSVYAIPDSVQPNKIFFADSLHGYAVCDSGYILKYIPTSISSLKEKNFNDFFKKDEFEFSIYPNPFNSKSKVKLKLKKDGKTKIELFNVLGQKLNTLVDVHLNSGLYEYEINLEKQNSGIYFIKITLDKNYALQKIILIK
ncbi:MAG: YCF48-related protein [Ignavibacteria bacterium]|nr:YCF48-related protein [Ignavibacteria bacterium]